MERPLSHNFSNIPVEGSGYWIWSKRGYQAGRVGWPGRVAYSCVTSNSEGHNFFVRTPFRVFLDSMESPSSQDSICMPLEGSEYWSYPKRGYRAGRVGWPGRATYSCVTSNFRRS